MFFIVAETMSATWKYIQEFSLNTFLGQTGLRTIIGQSVVKKIEMSIHTRKTSLFKVILYTIKWFNILRRLVLGYIFLIESSVWRDRKILKFLSYNTWIFPLQKTVYDKKYHISKFKGDLMGNFCWYPSLLK